MEKSILTSERCNNSIKEHLTQQAASKFVQIKQNGWHEIYD